jgi:hypothetical protein
MYWMFSLHDCPRGIRQAKSFPSEKQYKIRAYGEISGKYVETVCHGCRDPACAAGLETVD